MFENIVWCYREEKAPHHFKNLSFFKCVPDFENPENIPTLIVLEDSMDSACSTKVSQLFIKRSHHRNVSLVLITQKGIHQGPSGLDISLHSKYIVVFKILDTRRKPCTWTENSSPKTLPVFSRRTWKCVKIRTLIYSWT